MNYLLLVLIFFALLFDKLHIFFYMVIGSCLHECGHIAACIIYKYRPSIKISVFGIKLCNYPDKPSHKLFVLICGPLINLLLMFISAYNLYNDFSLDCYIFMCINLMIFLFNLLPVDFMDGGQILNLLSDSVLLRKSLNIISVIVILTVILLLSFNIIHSLYAFALFTIYFYINRKGLHL